MNPLPDNDRQNEPTPSFPWENSSLGIFRRFWDTSVGALFTPWRIFKRMPHVGGYSLPWLYLALCFLVLLVAREAVRWFLPSVLSPLSSWEMLVNVTLQMTLISPTGVGEGLQGDIIIWTSFLAFQLLFLPFIGAAVSHAFLWLFGAYQATFRAGAYACAIGFFSAIPFVGNYITIIWGIVVSIVAYKEAHGTDYWRVICASLPFALLAAVVMAASILNRVQSLNISASGG